MKSWMHKFEHLIDKSIPYTLILLLGIIVIEIFFKDFAHHYHTIISILDWIVISVFVFDLVFKYIRIRNVKNFIKKCWLDIIAVFPFFIFFRAIEGIAGTLSFGLNEGLGTFQSILHEGVEVEKEGAKIIEAIEKEGTRGAKMTRSTRFTRFVRMFSRTPRFLKAVPFYAKPTGQHHPHETILNNKKKAHKKTNSKKKRV
ncbi:hypothetical protein HN587_05965 [Candidatus Woesearchaeota archaeon]|jgi:hypothetical protein|nr:hypothetical protein [Candidatus Woesearchaeota archaeon]